MNETTTLSRHSNEWWIEEGVLHIGNVINNEGCKIPSFRYSYIPGKCSDSSSFCEYMNLQLFVDPNHPEYCFVYSTRFPLLDVWKYKIDNSRTVRGTIWSNTCFSLEHNTNDIYHIEYCQHMPYSPKTINLLNDKLVINWDDIDKSYFCFETENFITDIMPTRYFEDEQDWPVDKCTVLESPCNKYVIKYAEGFEFVDVFSMESDKFLFRLRHNTYHNYECCSIVEFVVTKDNELRIILNDHHSVLTVYDMKGNDLHSCDGDDYSDDFFIQKFRVKDNDKDYMVLYGYVWGQFGFMTIYDMEQLASNGSYIPDKYYESEFESLGKVPIEGNLVCCASGKRMSPMQYKEFIIASRNAKAIKKKNLLNEKWTEQNLLRMILQGKTEVIIKYGDDTQTIIESILDSPECPKITCIGGNSGSDFSGHAENIILYSVKQNDKTDAYVIDLIARLTCGNDYEKYASNGWNLQESNLIFTIDCAVTVQIITPMVPVPNKSTMWFPENDSDVLVYI